MRVFIKGILVFIFFLLGTTTIVGSTLIINNKFINHYADPFPEEQKFNFQLKDFSFSSDTEIVVSYFLQPLKDDSSVGDITELTILFVDKEDSEKTKSIVLDNKNLESDAFNNTEPISLADPFFEKEHTYEISLKWQEKNGSQEYLSNNTIDILIQTYKTPEISHLSESHKGVTTATITLKISFDESITDFETYSPKYFFSAGELLYTANGGATETSYDLFEDLPDVTFTVDEVEHQFVYELHLMNIKDDKERKVTASLQYNKKNIGIDDFIEKNLDVSTLKNFSPPKFTLESKNIPETGTIDDW